MSRPGPQAAGVNDRRPPLTSPVRVASRALLALLPCTLPVLLDPTPATGAPPVRVRARISLAFRTSPPTFTRSALRPVDRGRQMVLGNGLWAEQERFHLLRLSDNRRHVVTVPFADFVRRNPRMKVDPDDGRPLHKQFEVRRLLFYDTDNGEAGVEVADRLSRRRVRRHFFLYWNLRKQRITAATLVARSQPGKTLSQSLVLGYDHARRDFFFARQIYTWTRTPDGRRKGRTVTVVRFNAGKPGVLCRFTSARAIQNRPLYDRARRRVLLTEYAELADAEPPPRGFIVDLAAGRARSFEVPLTTYGEAFSADGSRLYLYSSQLGQLWSVDPATGRQVRRALKVGKTGHALGFVRPGQLLLIRNAGLRLLRVRDDRLRRGRFIPIRRLYKGFSHVQGSRVVPGGALIRNGDQLHVVDVN